MSPASSRCDRPVPGTAATADTGFPLTEVTVLGSDGAPAQPPCLAAPHEAATAESEDADPPSRDAHIGLTSSWARRCGATLVTACNQGTIILIAP